MSFAIAFGIFGGVTFTLVFLVFAFNTWRQNVILLGVILTTTTLYVWWLGMLPFMFSLLTFNQGDRP